MNKIFTIALACALAYTAYGQNAPTIQPYGKVDQADLELKQCDFEKDANAEVLVNKGLVYYGPDLLSITQENFKRIKIFNDNGKSAADIHIKYWSGNRLEFITGIQAETVNLVNGKVEITKLDRKQIFTKAIDKYISEITFTFPNVKAGSVIEYKFNWNANSFGDFPDWEFQEKIPVKYSELTTQIPDIFYYRPQQRIITPLVKYTTKNDGRSLVDGGQGYPYNLETTVRGIANIPSLPDEPYMSSFTDNVQSLHFQLVTIKPIGGFVKNYSDTWAKVGGILADDDDFGGQLKRKLDKEDDIIAKAKALKSDDERIAYVFNEVKSE